MYAVRQKYVIMSIYNKTKGGSNMTIKENIEALFDMWNRGEITGYRIAKDLKISPNLEQYRDGKRKIDNLTLSKATKLSDYYLSIKDQDKEKEEA